MSAVRVPSVWFPTVRTGTGTDVFTERLVVGLQKNGIRAEITWLPLRAEYAPWTVPLPKPPSWTTVAHVNTWLHPRFLPQNLPVVATIHHSVHSPDAHAYKGLSRAAYHRHWIAPNERRVLKRVDLAIAVSRFVADTAKKTLIDVPMQVIYNGVDTDKFKPGNRQRQFGEPFRLLYIGSWMTRKGVDLLAPIMRELGDGFELRYTGGKAAERDKPDMPPNMHDIGHLSGDDAVVAALQDVDALLFPSRSEGFGLVAAEAMACGVPVIATRGSSLIEVVADDLAGILCQQGNVAAFSLAARRVAAESEGTDRMATAARNQVVARFCFKGMVDAYARAYEVLMQARSDALRETASQGE